MEIANAGESGAPYLAGDYSYNVGTTGRYTRVVAHNNMMVQY